MFRSMRRSRQQLENDETIKILRSLSLIHI